MGGVEGGWRIGSGLLIAVACVFVNAAWVVADFGFPHAPRAVLETDHYRYIEMAKGPAAGQPELALEPPFAYRILLPATVRGLTALGADLHLAFYALSTLCGVAFLVVLYAILATWGFRVRERCFGVVLAAMLPGAIRWYHYQYWMTDPLALVWVALAVLAIRLQWTRALFGIALLGVATRESFVLVLPYYAVHLFRTAGAGAALRRGGALAALALAALAAIHLSIDAGQGGHWWNLARETFAWRWQRLFDNQLYFATLGSFGALLVLIVGSPRATAAHARHHYEDWVIVAGVYASLLLARNTDRLLVYALPVLLPVAMSNLHERLRAPKPWGSVIGCAVVVTHGVFFVQTQTAAVPALSINQPFNAWVTGFALALGMLWVTAPRRDPKRDGASREV
jgi:hypothetical protein